ncbi:hypothetical protein NDU88_004685 [Pleurodeles waltl]|uniref:Uncharacterized protein n=1 Tax=Pleurodeles waltl TaxID=8319 RepID=A0AAV7NLR2_PLEWA|nr:hypothetical protein NDU88_004685 [Pleurodeles waltl]
MNALLPTDASQVDKNQRAVLQRTIGKKRSAIPTWRLRTDALLDAPFREDLNACIKNYWDLNTGSTDLRATECDAHKVVVRGHCLSASWGGRSSLHNEVVTLENEPRALELAVAQGTVPFEPLGAKRRVYEEADQHLRRYDYNLHLTCLHTEGDSSGRLLAWLLRKEQQHAPIGAICLNDGTVVSSQEEINNAFKDDYTELYRQQPACDAQQLESFLSEAPLVKLQAPHMAALDEPGRNCCGHNTNSS